MQERSDFTKNLSVGESQDRTTSGPVQSLPANTTNARLVSGTEGSTSGQYPMRSLSLREDVSDSMTLIDDSAKHLFAVMKSVKPSQNNDGSDVMTQCEVAKRIAELARVKLDFIKAMK